MNPPPLAGQTLEAMISRHMTTKEGRKRILQSVLRPTREMEGRVEAAADSVSKAVILREAETMVTTLREIVLLDGPFLAASETFLGGDGRAVKDVLEDLESVIRTLRDRREVVDALTSMEVLES